MQSIVEDTEDGREIAAIAQKVFDALKENPPEDSDGLMALHSALALVMALFHCSHCAEDEDNAIIQFYDHMVQNFRRDVRFDWGGGLAGVVEVTEVPELDDADDPDETRH